MDNNSANPNNINTNPSSPISQPNPFPSINPLPTESKNTVPETNNLNSQSINEIIKPKKSNSFLIFILFLLLLIAAGTAAYFGYKYFELFKEKSSLSSLIIPSASPTTEPTTSTKKYNNEALGFSFDYPNDWEIEETQFNNNVVFGAGTKEEKIIFQKSMITLSKSPNEPAYWKLSIFSSPLEEVVSAYKISSPGGACSVTKTNDISLNNKSGKENVLECTPSDTQNNNTFLNYEWFIEHQGGTFVFSPGKNINNTEAVTSIYNTFKFIEATQSASPTNSPS